MRLLIVLMAGLIAATSAQLEDQAINRFDLDFHQAALYCKSQGGELHLPMSVRENKQMYQTMKEMNIPRMWIGAYGGSTRDNRTWYDLKQGVIEKKDQFWATQVNDLHGPNERCAEMRVLSSNTAENNWYDRPCHSKNPFVCHKFALYEGQPVAIREQTEKKCK